jgi:hypothetical protein
MKKLGINTAAGLQSDNSYLSSRRPIGGSTLRYRRSQDMSQHEEDASDTVADAQSELTRLAEIECRSLLAEQARQIAHGMRTPLSVIDLICATLQMELGDDRDWAARVRSAKRAVSELSGTLSGSLNSASFGDGAYQQLDAAEIAARIIALHGGDTESSSENGAHKAKVTIDPDVFEAAVLHALRLIGARGSNHKLRPLLRLHATGDTLTLRLSALDDLDSTFAQRQDVERDLLTRAAQRAARDSGGIVDISGASITFSLPVANERDEW